MNFDDIKTDTNTQEIFWTECVAKTIVKQIKKYLSIIRFLGHEPKEIHHFPVIYRTDENGEIDLSYPAIYITHIKMNHDTYTFSFIGNTFDDMECNAAVVSTIIKQIGDEDVVGFCFPLEFIEKYMTTFIRTYLSMSDNYCISLDLKNYEPIIEE